MLWERGNVSCDAMELRCIEGRKAICSGLVILDFAESWVTRTSAAALQSDESGKIDSLRAAHCGCEVCLLNIPRAVP